MPESNGAHLSHPVRDRDHSVRAEGPAQSGMQVDMSECAKSEHSLCGAQRFLIELLAHDAYRPLITLGEHVITLGEHVEVGGHADGGQVGPSAQHETHQSYLLHSPL